MIEGRSRALPNPPLGILQVPPDTSLDRSAGRAFFHLFGAATVVATRRARSTLVLGRRGVHQCVSRLLNATVERAGADPVREEQLKQ